MRFQREKLLIGEENFKKLEESHIIVFGVGGVGGFVVEALVRAGVGKITVVDFDTIDITNINRQIIANEKTIGKDKVKIIEERMKEINPKLMIRGIKEKYSSETRNIFFDEEYDYIVDAIDIVTAKLDLIEMANEKNISIISSMGTGNKINPMMLEITDINKTSVCPLARVMRKELKERRIKKLKVVYSKEVPIKPLNLDGNREKSSNVGSISFVPSVAGLIIGSEVVKDICKIKNINGKIERK
ncbi:MAG: tRNA threonylcarbamoyladenosine dehydratase [Fusobacterium sp. JB021]|nr:tRNA threonylcarbamoyladenosine dehydratase [Fusobacterium sp. JB020]MDP0494524.1 tRNA threonylcarbamoyladenosine dehydratase [Fusobacterium sp. JB021]MDP0507404.1 tRNA threonylcarbamoyladenosine dehydratase [Fusobacterium sp. JB019]